VPVYWPGGVRHEGGASPVCCICTERGKAEIDTARSVQEWVAWVRGSASSGRIREALSTVAIPLADRFVVVMKPL
jgi:hypothetical protein